MVADFFTKPLQGTQFTIATRRDNEFQSSIAKSYASKDCRSVLNIIATDEGQTKGIVADSEWTVVESKRAKRLASRTNGSLNRSVHGNGEAKSNRVRFEELD